MKLECEWRHPRKGGVGNFGDFWKKSWDLTLDEVSWDLSLGEASWFLSLGEASPVWAYGMLRGFVGSDGTVSIVKIVSLSPRVEKLKVKEVNKCFVPELKRVVIVSRISDSYAYEHFTYPYITIMPR